MFYREAGQFKTSYAADQAIFPIRQDRWFVLAAVLAAFVVPPLVADEYWLQAILIPLVVYALAALGLNILTGYAGQISLGTRSEEHTSELQSLMSISYHVFCLKKKIQHI